MQKAVTGAVWALLALAGFAQPVDAPPPDDRQPLESADEHLPLMQLIDMLNSGDPDHIMRAAAVIRLEAGCDWIVLSHLSNALTFASPQSDTRIDTQVRVSVTDAFHRLGAVSIVPLMELARNPNRPDVRLTAIKALRFYKGEASPANNILIKEGLVDGDFRIVNESVRTLAATGKDNDDVASALAKTFGNFRGTDITTDAFAAYAGYIVNELRGTEYDEVSETFSWWIEQGLAGAAVATPLDSLGRFNPDYERLTERIVRRSIGEALLLRGTDAIDYLAPLTVPRYRTDVRIDALKVLGRCEEDAERIGDIARAVLEARADIALVVGEAARTIGTVGDARPQNLSALEHAFSIRPAEKQFPNRIERPPQTRFDDTVQGEVGSVLVQFGEVSLPYLLRLAQHDDPVIRQLSLKWLGQLRHKGAVPHLIGVLADQHSESYELYWAVIALGEIGYADDAVIEALNSVRERSVEPEDIDPRSDEAVIEARRSEEDSYRMRLLVEALANLDPSVSVSVLRDMFVTAKATEDDDVKRRILFALRQYGPQARDAYDLIEQALSESNKRVTPSAIQAAIAVLDLRSEEGLKEIRRICREHGDNRSTLSLLSAIRKRGVEARNTCPFVMRVLADEEALKADAYGRVVLSALKALVAVSEELTEEEIEEVTRLLDELESLPEGRSYEPGLQYLTRRIPAGVAGVRAAILDPRDEGDWTVLETITRNGDSSTKRAVLRSLIKRPNMAPFTFELIAELLEDEKSNIVHMAVNTLTEIAAGLDCEQREAARNKLQELGASIQTRNFPPGSRNLRKMILGAIKEAQEELQKNDGLGPES